MEHLILPEEPPGTKCSWFGYPLVIADEAPFNRDMLSRYLETHKIETRPIMAGNMAEQPAMKGTRFGKIGSLENARLIMRNGLFFGIHGSLTERALLYVVRTLESFLEQHG